MKKFLEGSQAVAEVIKLVKPDVVAVYPITPQTHIIEALAQYKADGLADFEYIRAENEFASSSIVLGASAAGSRVYTASSSQGLLLMTEVLYNIAGMRLPVVMTAANRAVSAPLNIWNDQQDAMPARDSGWLMFFAKDNQEAADLHLMAYKLAEKLSLPAMVNMDGFVLTHTYEPVDIPTQAQVNKFIKKYVPKKNAHLNVISPVSLGCFATPDDYQEIRLELHRDLLDAKNLYLRELKKFKAIFGRDLGIIEYYGPKNATRVLVSLGAVSGTIRAAIDELNKSGQTTAALNITLFRPFPIEEIRNALKNKKEAIVLDRAISLGSGGILHNEISAALAGLKVKVTSRVTGLGGRDITVDQIKKFFSSYDK
ncbi:MAG: pyruvate ferredoxin oxidoreductase [Patescibacteria group bacterium]